MNYCDPVDENQIDVGEEKNKQGKKKDIIGNNLFIECVRFLGGDIKEFKCNNCGKAGHKAAECQAPSVNPCHLCAGRDHESGEQQGWES